MYAPIHMAPDQVPNGKDQHGKEELESVVAVDSTVHDQVPNVEDQHGNEELESVAAVDSTVHDDMYGGLNDSDLAQIDLDGKCATIRMSMLEIACSQRMTKSTLTSSTTHSLPQC
jgi:hypothetical protein